MKPMNFQGMNTVYAKDSKDYSPLPALKLDADNMGRVITCWALEPGEIQLISLTGQIWLQQMTFNNNLQPVFMTPRPEDLPMALQSTQRALLLGNDQTKLMDFLKYLHKHDLIQIAPDMILVDKYLGLNLKTNEEGDQENGD